jgi:molecular chaperone DnaK (HSP70)
MTLLGIDVNSTRIRAVLGPAGQLPHGLAFEGGDRDLPMALSLENRTVEVGRAGQAVCRRLPHASCSEFLPRLGTEHRWTAGRHRLSASEALAAVLAKVRPACASAAATVLAVPAYLAREQVEVLITVVARARWPLVGTVSAPLAAAQHAYGERPWTGWALVIDADLHALTVALVRPHAPVISLVSPRHDAKLGVRAWKTRLIDAIAERSVRQSRRDPRDSAQAEQVIYDQLDEVCDAWARDQAIEMVIQGNSWSQNVLLRPEETQAFCGPQQTRSAELVRAVLADSPMPVQGILVSEQASRLPGLIDAVREEIGERVAVRLLPSDGVCQAAHDLACRIQRGTLARGHHDSALPLATPVVSSTSSAILPLKTAKG